MGKFRTCVKYQKTEAMRGNIEGKELRCAQYREGPGTPPSKGNALRNTGRKFVCRHPAGQVDRVDCYHEGSAQKVRAGETITRKRRKPRKRRK